MNEEIKPGDLLAVNESGNVVKATNESKAIIGNAVANDGFAVYEDVGFLVRYASGIVNVTIPERICSHCKVSVYQHEVNGESILNHPFFNDNLEYLEWEASKNV